MKPNRVRVWIGPLASRGAGGGARYIQSLAANSVHRLLVVRETPELLWGLRWMGRRVKPLRAGYADYQRWIRRIDIAHVHRSILYAEAFRAARGKVPLIFTLHGKGFEEYWEDHPPTAKWIRENNEAALQAVRQADVATVVARWLRDWVEAHTGVSVAVTPPGVDLAEFEGSEPSEFSRWSGIPVGFVLWVGRLAREKRLDWFIQLASRLPERRFVVMANTRESEFRAEYGRELPSNLYYFGMPSRNHVISAFRGCSVHVNTSLYDAAPTTLLEAMACGKPVVAPDELGPREIVEESRAGYLFDSASLTDLEEKVLKAIDHPEVGRRGLDFVREERDWRKLAGHFDQQYSALGRG